MAFVTREEFLAKVKGFPMALQYAKKEFKADREIVLTAAALHGPVLQFASPELRSDEEVVRVAVKQYGTALRFASRDLQANRSIVMDAVSGDGKALKHASDELRSDKAVVMKAVLSDWRALEFAGPACKADKEIIKAAVGHKDITGSIIEHVSESLLGDRRFVLELVQLPPEGGAILNYLNDKMKADKEIVMAAVRTYPHAFSCASKKLHSDEEILLAAIKEMPENIKFASDEARSKRNIMIQVLKQDGHLFGWASGALEDDKDLLLLGARSEKGLCLPHGPAWDLADSDEFQDMKMGPLAVQGEDDAPTVVVGEPKFPTKNTDGNGTDEVGKPIVCNISLLSGAVFECCVAEVGRPTPTLNDLAKKVIEELPKHTEAPVKRVFISFSKSGGGAKPVVATPWQWQSPLSDFLPIPFVEGPNNKAKTKAPEPDIADPPAAGPVDVEVKTGKK
mmetsp:Transcript_16058/g.34714  ORF Transcript_16058/g.34714 Transcript_16058/m.34714 type:complete len:451 (+) Transcript_16058:100-1452(+)